MASRSPNDLHPDLQPLFARFMAQAEAQDIDVLCTCTWRSNAEQDELYAQGRTKGGLIVTRARAGQSAHNFTINKKPASRAFDIVPLRNGKCVWGVRGDDALLWQALGKIGTDLGLKWYGTKGSPFVEFPHFELKG